MAGISTAEESAESGAAVVGPPPPFDPELLPAISAMAEAEGPAFTLEMIPAIRRAPSAFPVPTIEDLRRDGEFEVTERSGARPGRGAGRLAADLPPHWRQRLPSRACTSSTAAEWCSATTAAAGAAGALEHAE